MPRQIRPMPESLHESGPARFPRNRGIGRFSAASCRETPPWGLTILPPANADAPGFRGPRAHPFRLPERLLARVKSVATTTAAEPTRRDFLYIATGAVGAVGAAFFAWPLIDQMNPSASVLALSSIEVDLTPIEVGQQMKVMWRGKPVFIRRRTPKEIAEARAVPLTDLPDQKARNFNLPDDAPATDADRASKPEWLILIGICTHLGCIPLNNQGEFGGYLCPCHGSQYDTAGRIRKGPAPENLAVPPYAFLNPTRIKIG